MREKELALARGPAAYNTAVRTGLCHAYLAASVVGSRLVSASKTGGMGKVGCCDSGCVCTEVCFFLVSTSFCFYMPV